MIHPDKGVSIVVCCYNSAGRLLPTLQHLISQDVPEGIKWEIIVVNNASTDDTAPYAKSILENQRTQSDFKIVEEPTPGLSNARKKGVITAKYEYILFCDDDNWLQSDYLYRVFEFMERNHEVGILSGRADGIYEVEPPSWFHYIHKAYAIGKQEKISGPTNAVWGAGLAMRKSAYLKLLELGFWHLNSDRLKDKLFCGGDTELCYALKRMGYVVWYQEDLVLQHFVPAFRLQKSYAKKLYYFIGYSIPAMSVYSYESEDFKAGSFKTSWVRAASKTLARWFLTIIRPEDYVMRESGLPKDLLLQLVKGKFAKLLKWRNKYSLIRKRILDARWNLVENKVKITSRAFNEKVDIM